mgnify:CR=1 FL=1
MYCPENDDAEHTLFKCDRFREERAELKTIRQRDKCRENVISTRKERDEERRESRAKAFQCYVVNGSGKPRRKGEGF